MKDTIQSPAAPPSPLRSHHLSERAGDRVFRFSVLAVSGVVVLIAIAMFVRLLQSSYLAWHEFGLKFLWTRTWNPVEEIYGALPFIFGTLVSSAIAILIAIPLGVGSAIFLEEMAPP